MDQLILVKYGEIALKGGNRRFFTDALADHLRAIAREYPGTRVVGTHGRFYIRGVQDDSTILRRLAKVPGVVAASFATKVENDMEAMGEAAVAAARQAQQGKKSRSFRVEARRALKSFPLTSPVIAAHLGANILAAYPELQVDLEHPDFTVTAEVRDDGTYVYWDGIAGMGGLSLGVSGKAVLLLSGGIDSPVAAYLAMKRGVRLIPLHFWSYPLTGIQARDKVVDIAKVMGEYDPQMRLLIAPFTQIQTAIMEKCPERFRVTIMRRMMMRVASRVAKKEGALAIFTGENLGQVASQTLESMAAIEDASSYPVLRPLLCYDKNETVEIARRIGTYDLSCLPYEDCCTIFVPRHPVIKPSIDAARDAEEALDVDRLAEDCANSIETIHLRAR